MGNKSKYQSQEPPKGFDLDYYQELYKTLKTPMDWAVVIYSRITFLESINTVKDEFVSELKKHYSSERKRKDILNHCFFADYQDKAINPIKKINVFNVCTNDILDKYYNLTDKKIVYDDKFYQFTYTDIVRKLDLLNDSNNYYNDPIDDHIYIKVNRFAPKSVLKNEFKELVKEIKKESDKHFIKLTGELKQHLPIMDLLVYQKYFDVNISDNHLALMVGLNPENEIKKLTRSIEKINKLFLTYPFFQYLCHL